MRQFALFSLGFVLCAGFAELAEAQICGPIYQVQPRRVYERQLEQRLRVVYDTVYEDRDIVTQRPVLKTRMEKRTYTVSNPVVETSTVQERYTVMKPVTKTEWIDRSYDETTYVTETQEKVENYTAYRPVTETTMQTQNYVVQRPVTETQYQTQQYTTYSPVTTYQNMVVDQGQTYAQQYYQPGDTRYWLKWHRPGVTYDAFGNPVRQRGGLLWTPYTSPGTTQTQLVYQPNPVQVSVPRTSMMPQVQTQQVPVQVTRMEDQMVQQQVPITTTRMEAYQASRRVPYQVQKPMTRRVERKEQVQRTDWVEQEMIRPKTVERTTYKLETVEREVPVQYYETQSVTTTVKVAKRVPRYESYTVTKLVPRTVNSPVVLSYYDPYSVSVSQGNRGWVSSDTVISSSTSTPEPSEKISYGAARPVVPEIDNEAELPPGGRVRKIEVEEPESDLEQSEEAGPSNGLELNSSGGDA
ncbi:MAG: hypothetical protein AAF483_28450 [Planctomycetota bacterium]